MFASADARKAAQLRVESPKGSHSRSGSKDFSALDSSVQNVQSYQTESKLITVTKSDEPSIKTEEEEDHWHVLQGVSYWTVLNLMPSKRMYGKLWMQLILCALHP